MAIFLAAASTDSYLGKMKKMYTIDASQLGKLDWLLVIAGTLATVVCICAFVYWLYKIIAFLWLVKLGKANVTDTRFWKRMGISLVIIMFFMTSGIFTIAEALFNVLRKSGWTM
jgi:hypothetical protein